MQKNELYPVFLKVDLLNVLIVGGGNVALEKLTFLLKSSPHARVTVIGTEVIKEIKDLQYLHGFQLILSSYNESYLHGQHIVIAATNDNAVNTEIFRHAKSRQLLVNVADTPELCDFYLGGIVTRGNLKIAISTNGKSPTMAKRLRQFFETVLPEDIDELVLNLNHFRKTIRADFAEKVSVLNNLTKELITRR